MISTDYPVEAMALLLERDCLSEKFYPLIGYKDRLLAGLPKAQCRTKNDAFALPDDALIAIGLPDAAQCRLFRRFLTLYDPAPQKFRELAKLLLEPKHKAAYHELYHLPGVKETRASLYFLSGYRSLQSIAETTVDEILQRTAQTIEEAELSCVVPFPKEARTHIAVAKAFTWKQ